MATLIIGALIALWMFLAIRKLVILRNTCGISCSDCSSGCKPASGKGLYEAYRKDHKKPMAS